MSLAIRSAVVLAVAGLASAASAQIYLSGVVSFGANSNGFSITEPAEFDNIVGTNNSPVTINSQPRGTTFLLSDGPNAFSFAGVFGSFNALSLYFAADGAAFSRPFGSAPDLAVFGFNGPQTPVVGASVQTNGQFSGTVPYSGATSFTLGDRSVSVTDFTFNPNFGRGTFVLTVVPAPSAVALCGIAGLVATRRRR
jgi:hypothetical protein